MNTRNQRQIDWPAGGPIESVQLFWRLMRDQRVAPKLKKLLPLSAAIYFFSPIDLIPDVLLGVGQLDDLGIVGLAVGFLIFAIKAAPADVVAEHIADLRGEPAAKSSDRTPSQKPSGDERVYEASYRVNSQG